ncbi:MAG TPA: HK97 gp10 family phage protein [Planctomycetota bacterium]|jgi:hypothetical protein|nr:HK97 gp10 family phage protein [Planctomycetota bacterium]
MSAPFISLDVGNLTAQVARVKDYFDKSRGKAVNALAYGMTLFMEDTMAEASAAAPVRSGDLRKSVAVTEPIVDDHSVSITGGFNIGYARQVDFGGPIFSKTKMLSIPLDPILTGQGVSMYSSPLEEDGLFVLKLWGKVFLAKKMGKTDKTIQLHWLLKDNVMQPGTDFFSNVIAARKSVAVEAIAGVVAQDLETG